MENTSEAPGTAGSETGAGDEPRTGGLLRRRWKALVAALVVALVLAAGGWALYVYNQPRLLASAVFDALVDDDMRRVVELAPEPRPEGTARTVVIPNSDGEGLGIESYEIRSVDVDGHGGHVDVWLEGRGGTGISRLYVERDRDAWWQPWSLAPIEYPSLSFHAPEISGGLEVSGEWVPWSELHDVSEDEHLTGSVALAPGTHTLALADLGEFVAAEPETVTLPPKLGPGSGATVALSYELTAAGEERVQKLAEEHLGACVAGEAEQECPFDSGSRPRPPSGSASEVDWEVLEMPHLEEIVTGPASASWTAQTVEDGRALFTFTDTDPDTGEDIETTREVPFSIMGRIGLTAEGELTFEVL